MCSGSSPTALLVVQMDSPPPTTCWQMVRTWCGFYHPAAHCLLHPFAPPLFYYPPIAHRTTPPHALPLPHPATPRRCCGCARRAYRVHSTATRSQFCSTAPDTPFQLRIAAAHCALRDAVKRGTARASILLLLHAFPAACLNNCHTLRQHTTALPAHGARARSLRCHLR